MTEAATTEADRGDVLVLPREWRVEERAVRPQPEAEIRVVGTDTVRPLRLAAPLPSAGGIDREEVRRLVAEALRQEMRSQFGRDLTGAVRRFVRSEVARLLAGLRSR